MAELILYYRPYAMAAAVSFVFFALYWDERTRRRAVEQRFSVVVDADAEARQIVRKVKSYAQKLVDEATEARTVAPRLKICAE